MQAPLAKERRKKPEGGALTALTSCQFLPMGHLMTPYWAQDPNKGHMLMFKAPQPYCTTQDMLILVC